jgi:hypothetical protein
MGMQLRKGQRFRALHDVPLNCLTHWSAPFTGGLKVVLPGNEVLIVEEEPPVFAAGAYMIPERYDHFLTAWIPESERLPPKFEGYSLAISFDELAQSFQEEP